MSTFAELPKREQLALLAQHPEFKKNPELQALYQEALEIIESNPLQRFEPHSKPQRAFIEALTKVVAAFAGNQFGKTTSLVVCSLRELLPASALPEILRVTKRFEPPVHGWIVCPSEDKIFEAGGFKDAFEEWCPKSELKGGNWGKAFNGARMSLSFTNDSSVTFKTYGQDPATLGGARLHFVGYDEPPPRKHREECRVRTVRYGGYEMFAMTPLAVNTGYVRRSIWKQRESPDITVVKGSIHDNPMLDKKTVELTLGDMSDAWRRAREFGDFVDVGGLIYPEFERSVVSGPWSAEFVRSLDVVVGIDPGIRNTGIVWVGFDNENVAHVFAAALLQDKTPKDYARTIRAENARWGLRTPQYVVDPAARSRGQTNAETVLSALATERVYATPGQNDVEAGIGQLRIRMSHGRFFVSPEPTPGLLGLREEADEYAAKEPDEGKDDSHMEPIKSNDHRLDALRYAVMERFWDPVMEDQAPLRTLGFDPSRALPSEYLKVPAEGHPTMGSMF